MNDAGILNANIMDMSKIPMEFLHFPEETPEEFLKGREQNAMMDGEPMPEPEPEPEPPLTQRLFPFGRLQDRCPPGEHFCKKEGKCVPEGKKIANQDERIHHIANSTMNHKPKEVGPVTMMDTNPNEMPRQNMGWPQDTTQTSGVFGPLHPTLSPLEPSSSNRPCDPGFVLNPVTGHCDPTNLINLHQGLQEKHRSYLTGVSFLLRLQNSIRQK